MDPSPARFSPERCRVDVKTLFSVRLGCPKNNIDSEVMEALLEEEGFSILPAVEGSQIILINTCAFIEPAREEAVEEILHAVDLKNRGLCDHVIVAGCLVQRYGAELVKELPEVDLFIGTGEVGRIADHIALVGSSKDSESPLLAGKPDFLMTAHHPRRLSSQPATAWIKIAEGCSNHCSYCVIPSIRGAYRSRTPEDIIEETERLAREGVKELVLTAQETTAYGFDLPGRPSLARLMQAMASVEGIRWIRLLYTHPRRLDDALFQVMAGEDKICSYLDVPLQHIDDDILRAMNRRCNSRDIRNILGRAREAVPGISLRTSFIVGFPGEKRQQFKRLLDFVRETRFDHLGVFTYSREEGTKAAAMEGQVPRRTAEARRDRIMREQAIISREINESRIGSIQEVLIEEYADFPGYTHLGRTRFQAPEIDGATYVTSPGSEPGDMVRCRVVDADTYDLFAEEILEP